MNKWVKYPLWLVGTAVLLFVTLRIETHVYLADKAAFTMKPEVWIVSLISVIMGIYLSLLFISGKPSFNAPLFICVFIPTLVVGFYLPVAMDFGLRVPAWFLGYDQHGFIHITCGLSLATSLFNGRKKASKFYYVD